MPDQKDSEKPPAGIGARLYEFFTRPRDFGESLILGGVVYAAITFVIILLVTELDWDIAGLAFSVVFASSVVGVMTGFLFGIPKVGVDGSAESLTTAEKLVRNTNLGRVSDWLTTIVVGLGIAQFEEVLEGLRWLGERFGVVFSSSDGLSRDAAAAFGISLVLASLGIGFVMMYMWTSTRLLEVLQGKGVGQQGRAAAGIDDDGSAPTEAGT